MEEAPTDVDGTVDDSAIEEPKESTENNATEEELHATEVDSENKTEDTAEEKIELPETNVETKAA